MKYLSTIIVFAFLIPKAFSQKTPLANDNSLIVQMANRIEGKWQITDINYTDGLSGPKQDESEYVPIEFKIDPSVADSFVTYLENQDINEDFKGFDIYAAGEMYYDDMRTLFVLVEYKREPILLNFGFGAKSAPGMYQEIKMDIRKYAGDDICWIFQGDTKYTLSRIGLNYEISSENVVATHLEGEWTFDSKLSKQLNPEARKMSSVSFKVDSSIINQIPVKYYSFLSKNRIYLAGTMNLEKKDFPFILTTLNGNPHLFFFRERNGKPLGDSESFNLSIAVGEKKSNDLLLIGGDFNNQPFSIFKRKK